MNPVIFFVPGRPISKLRPRGSVKGGKVSMRTPPALKEWKVKVAWVAAKHIQEPFSGEVQVDLLFMFDDGRWAGDKDNLDGAVYDALNGVDVVCKKDITLPGGKVLRGQLIQDLGRAWEDDRLVHRGTSAKLIINTLTPEEVDRLGGHQLKAGVFVHIRPLERSDVIGDALDFIEKVV